MTNRKEALLYKTIEDVQKLEQENEELKNLVAVVLKRDGRVNSDWHRRAFKLIFKKSE